MRIYADIESVFNRIGHFAIFHFVGIIDISDEEIIVFNLFLPAI